MYTRQQVLDQLQVSDQVLDMLLGRGDLEGFEEEQILAYKKARVAQNKALDELAQFSQEQMRCEQMEASTTQPLDWDDGSRYDVVLDRAGPRRLLTVNQIRKATGIGLLASMALLDQLPAPVQTDLTRDAAEDFITALQAVGAKAYLEDCTNNPLIEGLED